MRIDFQTIEAEYEALIAGLRLAIGIGARKLHAYSDSQLVTSQYHGEIPRGENSAADALAALASTSEPLLKRIIPVEGIHNPSIDIAIKSAEPKEIATITNEASTSRQTPEIGGSSSSYSQTDESQDLAEQLGPPIELQFPKTADLEGTARERRFVTDEQYHARPDWRIPIFEYIQNGTQPSDKWEARKLRAKCSRYCIMTGILYKRSLVEPYLRCVNGLEALAILANTQDGICGSHSSGRALANSLKRHGYFWPTMLADCDNYAAKCDKCQKHAPIIHQPAELLSSVSSLYPFMRWAMDILGPMIPSGRKQHQYLLVLTYYFIKWVEAKAYPKVEATDVTNFVWTEILCGHGIPYEIVTNPNSYLEPSNDSAKSTK
ncbi:unnamed protein product [Microthlaspi erraticum]|uniref:RNase H type-1 domain-containing protein n=1 Tax=Microthlaspi erraticum TaxID=1685480 RepID=A0A6D2IQ97_9BRAS|nr:unnamed protein product [Microthlaspi erraticum]